MTDFIDDLVAKIDRELARSTAEIEQLKQGRQALLNGIQPATAPATKRLPATNRRRRPGLRSPFPPKSSSRRWAPPAAC